MDLRRSLLTTSIIKPFYRENAGLLCFVYYIMFLAVGRANGVGIIDYHYSLIYGMLTDVKFLFSVFAIWTGYAIKCSQFVARTFRKHEFSYLNMLALLENRTLFFLLLKTHAIIFLPVLSYLVIILTVGYRHRWHLSTTAALLINIILVIVAAARSFHVLKNPGKTLFRIRWKLPSLLQRKFYAGFLVRYVLEENKVLFIITKLYNCGVLYLLLDGRVPGNETDLRMVIFFYYLGMLGHGVIIHRLKQMENTRLTFYRLMPVSLFNRFIEYFAFYFLLFVPEIITIISVMPNFVTYAEAGYFLFFGFGTLLLLNSLQLFNYTGLREYFKTLLQIFIVFLISLITRTHFEFSILIFALALVLFFTRYYYFEPQPDNVMR